jgi:hypothetical protein
MFSQLPHSFKMHNKAVSTVKSAEAFNNYVLNMVDDLYKQTANDFHRFHF